MFNRSGSEIVVILLLALVVLVPWMLRYLRSNERLAGSPSPVVDWLIVLFGALQVASMLSYEPATRTVLRTVLYFLDVFAIYYVASRSCTSKERIVEVMACFALTVAVLAPMGLFEAVRTWPLYGGINNQWGQGGGFLLFREGIMRSAVTAGHALTLGYYAGIGFGIWLYVSRRIGKPSVTAIGAMWMWAGLLAAYSRAPWLMGATWASVMVAIWS